MVNYINRDRVIQANILKPIEAEDNMYGISHGWQVNLTVGYQDNGYPIYFAIDYNSEKECIDAIKKLNFIEL